MISSFRAALLAIDIAGGYRFDLCRRLGRSVRRETLGPPRSPLVADRYVPAGGRSAEDFLLIVHGLAPLGRTDERLARLAGALAACGLEVLVPDLPSFREQRITEDDTDTVAAALRVAGDLAGSGRRISAGAFSYAAGPLYVAASRSGLRDRVHSLYLFGGFHDLRAILAFGLTGTFVSNGRLHRLEPDPFVRQVAARFLAGALSESEKGTLGGTLDSDEVRPDTRLRDDPSLPDKARVFVELLLETDPAAVMERLGRFDAGLDEAMRKVSPASVSSAFPGRVLMAHSTADNLIPYTESLSLADARESEDGCDARGRDHLLLLRDWTHVDRGGGSGTDAEGRGVWALYRFLCDLLSVPRT